MSRSQPKSNQRLKREDIVRALTRLGELSLAKKQASRSLDKPWFALPYRWARAGLILTSPPAFRERNLFTTGDALQRA